MKLQSNVAILHCHYWILSGPYTLFSACSGSRGAPSWQWCSSCNSCPKHQWYPVSTGCAQAPCWRPGWGQGSNHGCARAHRETWRSRVFDPQGSCDLASQSIHLTKVVTQQVINLLVCSLIFCSWWSHSPAQMRLRAAGKARLIRWVKPKAKRKDREAPEFVKQQWATGCKNAVADLFSKVNFNQEIWLSIAISNLHVSSFNQLDFKTCAKQIMYQSTIGRVREPADHSGEEETVGGAYPRRRLVFRKWTEKRSGLESVLVSVLSTSCKMFWMPVSLSVSCAPITLNYFSRELSPSAAQAEDQWSQGTLQVLGRKPLQARQGTIWLNLLNLCTCKPGAQHANLLKVYVGFDLCRKGDPTWVGACWMASAFVTYKSINLKTHGILMLTQPSKSLWIYSASTAMEA